jgi:hypothetical protein
MALVVVAAAEAGHMPERFGLGAYLVVAGPSVVGAGLVVPDDLDRRARRTLESWASSHPVTTTTGPRPWSVVTLSQFYDPFVGEFIRRAYSGTAFCVGADLGRVFGLAAEHWGPRRGAHSDSWEVWLPGWGRRHPDGRWMRRSPHRPALRVAARRVGWQVEFGPCGTDADGATAGKRVRGRIWPGRFLDVLSLAYALDGDRSASFAEHCANFGLEASELPLSGSVDDEGAAAMADAVLSVHALAVGLDRQAADWLTTSEDRSEGRGRLDLVRISSPGSVAAEIPARLRLAAPLHAFDLEDNENAAWAEAFHGGWCEVHPAIVGVPMPVVSADVSSCYPLIAHLLGWWDVMCAERLERCDVTEILQKHCRAAIADPRHVLNPKSFAALGLTLVKVRPEGESWPIEVEDERRPDGRMEVVAVSSSERDLWFPWPDVVAAAVRSRRVPHILDATRYVPVGRQSWIRKRLAVLPGLILSGDEDPVLALVSHRGTLKANGDGVLAAELRVVTNSLVFGIMARFDEVRSHEGRRLVFGERPGPWTFLPIAASVASGARLLLAVLDRLVADAGGIVAYRDTDSSLIPALPNGGPLNSSSLRALSWAEVDGILGAFDRLSTSRRAHLWDIERGRYDAPLHALVYGPKRRVEFVITRNEERSQGPSTDEENVRALPVVDRTEAQLGGTFVDPPNLPGRAPIGGRAWSLAAAEREIDYSLAKHADRRSLRPPAFWDFGEVRPVPALRRFMVKTPELARSLPSCLDARPGTRYVVGVLHPMHRGSVGSPVALDPGGDLRNWRALRWFDRATGQPVPVTTDPNEIPAVLLDTLASRGAQWSRPSPAPPIVSVFVDPRLVREVGRVSGVIDADLDDLPGDLASRRLIYGDAERAAAVSAHAQALGPRRFARQTGLPLKVAERAALGKAISARNVAKALNALRHLPEPGDRCPVDGRIVVRNDGAIYCTNECQDQAYRLRRQAREQEPSTQASGMVPAKRERKT